MARTQWSVEFSNYFCLTAKLPLYMHLLLQLSRATRNIVARANGILQQEFQTKQAKSLTWKKDPKTPNFSWKNWECIEECVPIWEAKWRSLHCILYSLVPELELGGFWLHHECHLPSPRTSGLRTLSANAIFLVRIDLHPPSPQPPSSFHVHVRPVLPKMQGGITFGAGKLNVATDLFSSPPCWMVS